MSSPDDGLGCVVAIAVMVGGIWWASQHYEVVEKTDEVAEADALYRAIADRPIGNVELTTTRTDTKYYLEAGTVLGDRSGRRGWVTQDHSQDNTVSWRSSRELVWTNCETGEVRHLSSIRYDKEGVVVSMDDHKFEDADASYYPPDTVGASAPSEMCRDVYDPLPE